MEEWINTNQFYKKTNIGIPTVRRYIDSGKLKRDIDYKIKLTLHSRFIFLSKDGQKKVVRIYKNNRWNTKRNRNISLD